MSELNTEPAVDTDVSLDSAPAELAEGFTPDAPQEVGDESGGAVEGTKEAAPAADAFTPNFKFKAMGQEKEIDDWAKPWVKDADSEKNLRELYEKAHGLEPVKQKLHRTREQLGEVSEAHGQMKNFFEESVSYRNSGDYGKLFEYWKIDPVAIAKWLSREIEMNDPNTPPHVKEAYRQSLDATRRNNVLERENRSLENSQSEGAVQTLTAELHSVMSQPDVAQLQQSVDARTGKTGTFYNMVVRHAIASESREGRILSADEAVKEVMEEMGVFMQEPAAPKAPAAPGLAPRISKAAAPAASQPSPKPSTLPRASQSTSTPLKKNVTSTDDLRNLYKTRFGNKAA